MISVLARSAIARLFPQPPRLDSDTFVLWEPCTHSHGEIVPGYAKYLLDLGYKVLVLLTPARLVEGLFSRMSDPRLTLGTLTQPQIRRFMRSGAAQAAAGVMVTTAGKLPEAKDRRPDLPAVFSDELPRNLLLVEHDARPRITAGSWDPETITLRRVNVPGVRSVVVNPHHFGTFTEHPKAAGKTVFLMAGAARSKRRNQDIVLSAVRRLLEAGETGFELRLIGKPGSEALPKDLASHITEVGRVSFTQLYAETEACDFVLTAFQRDNPDHAFYRTTGTSGSFQLAYGFHKPCILQKDFMEGTALNSDNSLVYDSDDQIFDAMLTAVRMDVTAHAAMRRNMAAAANRLHASSLMNLRNLING